MFTHLPAIHRRNNRPPPTTDSSNQQVETVMDLLMMAANPLEDQLMAQLLPDRIVTGPRLRHPSHKLLLTAEISRNRLKVI